MFLDVTVSKFLRKHAVQFNFHRCKLQSPATKIEIYFHLLKTATFQSNFEGLLLKKKTKKKQRRKMEYSNLAVSGFHFYQCSHS